NGVGLIIMSQLTAKLVAYMNRYLLLIILTTIQIVGVILIIVTLTLHLPLWVLIIAFFLNVCPVTGIGPLSFALAMESRTGGSGNASSLLGLFQFILGGIMSPLVGLQGEYSVLPYITILVITAILIICLEIVFKSILFNKQLKQISYFNHLNDRTGRTIFRKCVLYPVLFYISRLNFIYSINIICYKIGNQISVTYA